jgi:hypothetical protein
MAAEVRPTMNKTAGQRIAINVQAARVAGITHDSLATLTALGKVGSQTFGAGAGKVGIIGDAGLVASSVFSVPISKATGLSAFTPGKLVLGDKSNNSVFVVDIASKQANKLFALNELNASGIQAASVLQNGELGGLAFDGKFIYAGVGAGYSSSIFKIDPSTKTVVAHSWAPGPNPSAMEFFKGNLFVLEANRQSVRRLDSQLRLSHARTDIEVQDGKGLIVSDEGVSILSPSKRSIERLRLDTSKLIRASTQIAMVNPAVIQAIIQAMAAPQKYAVLICGDVAESGFDEFWGDTVWMYKMLRAKGYSKENIYVCYGNGADYACPNPTYQMPGETVTDFAATPAWVDVVFNGLKNGDAARGIKKMKDNDSLFVWTFDHGGGGPTNSYLCLMGGSMTDTHFASKLNAVAYDKRMIFMQQCRSGGFIDNLANSKTFISTACRGDQNAQEADTEKEYWGGKWYHHGEYNYYIIGAFDGKYPNGTAVNADSNGNGKVSCIEAHNWDVTHENKAEVPQVNYSGTTGAYTLN